MSSPAPTAELQALVAAANSTHQILHDQPGNVSGILENFGRNPANRSTHVRFFFPAGVLPNVVKLSGCGQSAFEQLGNRLFQNRGGNRLL